MHIKQTLLAGAVAALFMLPLASQAATCRASTAAETGSSAGYAAAQKAAAAWYTRESSASSKLQECLDKIRTLSLTMPSFTSLSSILNQYADQICSTAVTEVNSYIPSSIDPWDSLTG